MRWMYPVIVQMLQLQSWATNGSGASTSKATAPQWQCPRWIIDESSGANSTSLVESSHGDGTLSRDRRNWRRPVAHQRRSPRHGHDRRLPGLPRQQLLEHAGRYDAPASAVGHVGEF